MVESRRKERRTIQRRDAESAEGRRQEEGWLRRRPAQHLGNGEDEQGNVIVPVGAIEIRQSAEDSILDFGGS